MNPLGQVNEIDQNRAAVLRGGTRGFSQQVETPAPSAAPSWES